jgi:hypothetical protein
MVIMILILINMVELMNIEKVQEVSLIYEHNFLGIKGQIL